MIKRDGLPTGSGTGPQDVIDPHPSNEEHYDRQKNPGGAHPPKDQIGPKDAIPDGKPKKRPPPRLGAPG